MSIGIFKIDAGILNEVKQREKDLFNVLISELQKLGRDKQPLLIIDEIQTLEDIYINGEKELLKEFLNFCVRLTKELHISHVVILSSNTIFINKICNDAKLKVTSQFYKIDHLDFKTVSNWLTEEKFSKAEIELIWDYLGGSVAHIQRMIRDRSACTALKEYLDQQAFLTYTEMVLHYSQSKLSQDEKDIFEHICKEILKNSSFELTKDKKNEYLRVIESWAEKEIFFFDPMTLKVNGNSRIYEKGMGILLSH